MISRRFIAMMIFFAKKIQKYFAVSDIFRTFAAEMNEGTRKGSLNFIRIG